MTSRRRTPPYRAALVGCGRVGFLLERDALRGKPCTHAGGIASHPDFKLVSGCDIDPARLSDFGSTYGIPQDHLYARVEDMLKAEHLDVLSIATWTESHDTIAHSAFRSGIPVVICEKPMAVTFDRARKMAAAARRARALLVINHGRRWMSEFQTVRRCVREKWYGPLRHVQACVLTPFRPKAKARGRRGPDWHSIIESSGGGPLLHDGTHLLDIVFFVTGRKLDWVEASLDRPRRSAVELGAWGRLHFAGDPPLDFWFEASGGRRYFHFEVEMWFESGRIVVGNGIRRAETSIPSRRYEGFRDLAEDPDFPWEKSRGSVETVCMAEIARWFSTRRRPENTADQTILSQEAIFAAYESAVRNRRIRFPYRSRLTHPLHVSA